MATPSEASTRDSVSPPAVRSPKLVQNAPFASVHRAALRRWTKQYGPVFEVDVPVFGRSVVVSDPALVKEVCTASTDELDNMAPNLSNWFGPGSTFGLHSGEHRDRRRLLGPTVHGHSVKNYEQLIVDETARECATWPEGSEFRTFESMNRITLAVILRIALGADGADRDELSKIVPSYMRLGQSVALVPDPPLWVRRYGRWGKLDALRTAFDRIVSTLIDKAHADLKLDDRTDILAALVRAQVPTPECCDELLTYIGAGHITTGAALSWVFERLRRHPDVLAELVREVDEGGGALRRATILELLRARPVIDVFGRRVNAPGFDLGQWRIPADRTVLVRIADVHGNPEIYPSPERFYPYRFLHTRPTASTFLPFGGGARRCIGADFAIAEMDIVLRTVLQNFSIQTDETPDEKPRFRGLAHVPKLGGRIVVKRRNTARAPLPIDHTSCPVTAAVPRSVRPTRRRCEGGRLAGSPRPG